MYMCDISLINAIFKLVLFSWSTVQLCCVCLINYKLSLEEVTLVLFYYSSIRDTFHVTSPIIIEY